MGMFNFYISKNDSKFNYWTSYWINKLNEFYNQYDFKNIHSTIKNINYNFILKKEDINFILDIYNSNIKLKRIVEKIQIKFKTNKLKKTLPINNLFLDLTPHKNN